MHEAKEKLKENIEKKEREGDKFFLVLNHRINEHLAFANAPHMPRPSGAMTSHPHHSTPSLYRRN